MNLPILYSFRRCPYAMRARLALVISHTQVQLREVVLKNKPAELLNASAKGTVPVLILQDGQVIDESLDILQWALQGHPDANWKSRHLEKGGSLIQHNDGRFKHWLDRYKYADRYPENTTEYYRQQATLFIDMLESCLQQQPFLINNSLSDTDIAILPFVRQFAFVDRDWFNHAPYPKVRKWLDDFCQSDLFNSMMSKYPAWQQGDKIILFP